MDWYDWTAQEDDIFPPCVAERFRALNMHGSARAGRFRSGGGTLRA